VTHFPNAKLLECCSAEALDPRTGRPVPWAVRCGHQTIANRTSEKKQYWKTTITKTIRV